MDTTATNPENATVGAIQHGHYRRKGLRRLVAQGAVIVLAIVTLAAVLQQLVASASASGRLSLDGLSGALPGSTAPRKDGVSHIVLFSFKSSVRAADVNKASNDLMELKDTCLHPITEKPYIRSIRGGKNVSLQELNSGVTHAFVVEFDSPEHRDYYIEQDPVHKSFLEQLKPLVDSSKIVVEFTDGKFT